MKPYTTEPTSGLIGWSSDDAEDGRSSCRAAALGSCKPVEIVSMYASVGERLISHANRSTLTHPTGTQCTTSTGAASSPILIGSNYISSRTVDFAVGRAQEVSGS